MDSKTNFILKVLVLSSGISAAIKYGGSSLPIAATSVNALTAVLTPTLILTGLLLWRSWKYWQFK